MSSRSVIVLLSTSVANSSKLDSIRNALAGHHSITIENDTTVVLNDEQKQSIPIENISQFCSGPIVSYLLQTEAELNFDAIKKSNKLSKNDIFETNDPYFVTKLKRFLFPQKPSLEQTLIICDPVLSEDHLNEITKELKAKGMFILFQNQISSENHENMFELFNKNVDENSNEEKQETDTIQCSAILCESFDCTDKIRLIIGCNESWNKYTFTQVSNESKLKLFIPKLATQQTLALIKPTAVRKGYTENIINQIEENGFIIISQKRVHLKIEHAQHFYKEHENKAFFDGLTLFMSSGPIYAFILEKVEAIACWRILLESLRTKYGTDQTENACHGSDSILSSKREITFFFPENSISSDEIKTKTSATVVTEYMTQKLQNDESLKSFLIRGLSELAQQKPSSDKWEVVEWFGNWLLNNNPNQPQIDEPSDMMLID